MTLLRESFLYRFWMTVLLPTYEDSAVHRALVRLGAWCNGQIENSAV